MEEWDQPRMYFDQPFQLHSSMEEWDRPNIELDRLLNQPMGYRMTTYDSQLEVVAEEQ